MHTCMITRFVSYRTYQKVMKASQKTCFSSLQTLFHWYWKRLDEILDCIMYCTIEVHLFTTFLYFFPAALQINFWDIIGDICPREHSGKVGIQLQLQYRSKHKRKQYKDSRWMGWNDMKNWRCTSQDDEHVMVTQMDGTPEEVFHVRLD